MQAFPFSVIRVVKPPGHRSRGIGYKRRESRQSQTVFKNLISFFESGFDIPLNNIGKGNIPSFWGIVSAAHGKHSGNFLVRCPDNGCIRFSSLKYIDNMRQYFPFNIKLPQRFFADILAFCNNNDSYFLAFIMRYIVKIRPRRPKAAAAELFKILILPGKYIHNTRNSPGPCSINTDYPSMRIRTAQKFGMEHVWNYIVDTVFGNTCSHGI